MSYLDLPKYWGEQKKFGSPALVSLFNDAQKKSAQFINSDIVSVRVGSDSDLPKINPYLEELRRQDIPYFLSILSAHRTPNEMAETARALPNLMLHYSLDKLVSTTGLRVKFAVGAAGGSAHLAGMSASETQVPFLGNPVASSACEQDDSSLSMINMPPHKPNGFVPNNQVGARVSKLLFDMNLPNGYNKVGCTNPDNLSDNDKMLMSFLGIEIDQSSPIQIIPTEVEQNHNSFNGDKFNIFIPLKGGEEISTFDMLKRIQNFKNDGVYMGMQKIDGKTNYTNAIIFAAQILGIFTPKIRQRAEQHSIQLAYEVGQKRLAIETGQMGVPFDQIINLPPHYKHLYSGKVRETYEYPGRPDLLIMIATDRISTHDVIHKNQIPGKGKALTQISNYWFKKLEENESTKDIPTHVASDIDFPDDFPGHLKERAIIVKKTTPLRIEAIQRGFLYGSIEEGYNPETGKLATGEYVGKGLQKCNEFKEPIFTPSTKSEKGDINISFDDMVSVIRTQLITIGRKDLDAIEIANKILDYSKRIYDFCRKEAKKKGYTLADMKLEFGLNENGEVILIDETCTPDSSRFWLTTSIIIGKEPESADKQPTRNEVIKIWQTVPDRQGRVKPKQGKSEDGWKPYPVYLTDRCTNDTSRRYKSMEKMFS